MNGAMAEPSASTSSPPSPHMITITGISQNFLRMRRNRHSSTAKSSINSSELVRHRRLMSAHRGSGKPIARLLRLQTKPQRIPTNPPHDDPDRGQHAEKYNAHYNWIDDSEKLQR